MRRFYLSRFSGDGRTLETAFRPYVAEFAIKDRWGFLDMRRDQSTKSGWCIAAIDTDQPPPEIKGLVWLRDLEYLDLGECLDSALAEPLRERISTALSLEFCSTSLREIIAEVQLRHTDFEPDGEGIYRIRLIDVIWTATEEEAFAFLAQCVFPLSDRFAFETDEPPSVICIEKLRSEVAILEDTSNSWREGWVADAARKHSNNKHPFASAIRAAKTVIEGGAAPATPHRFIWMRRMARNLAALHGIVAQDRRLGSRLCNPVDCLSVGQELAVMAAYHKAGAVVQSIDDDDGYTGECTVTWPDVVPVHIECKLKSIASLRPHDSQHAFERIRNSLFQLMEESGRFVSVMITSRYDPTDEDLPRTESAFQDLLHSKQNRVRDGKLAIEIIGSAAGEFGGIQAPKATFATAEGHVESDGTARQAKGVAWRTIQRWRWIRSALHSLKNASKKIPAGQPGIVYLQIPEGELPIAWLRVQIVAYEVSQLLQHEHARFSAVVVMGDGFWFKNHRGHSDETAVTTTFYEVIENSRARVPLPSEFRIFGKDFRANS